MIILLDIIKKYWIGITLINLALITFLSLNPLENLPPISGSDKTRHFIAYGVLVFPLSLRKPKYWLFISLLFLCWSGAIELIQPYVNRFGEWLDMLANTIGILCGILVAHFISWILTSNLKPD